MSKTLILLRWELSSVIRSRWLVALIFGLGGCTFGLGLLSDDASKTLLTLTSILLVLAPLVSILFSTTYWYNSEPFTQLLLSQPLSRRSIFWARSLSMILALCLVIILGLVLPGLILGIERMALLLLFVACLFLISIFYFLGVLLTTGVRDRMWGIALSLGIWFFWIVLYDALLFLLLFWFREYPMERVTSLLCAFNPIDLARVSLLLYFDAPLNTQL